LKVAVTGATGFIGSSMALYLRDRGCQVTAFSRKEALIDDLRAIAIDFTNITALQKQLKDVEAVVHLAGLAHRLENKYSLDDYIRANVDTTISLAIAAKSMGVRRFIFVSSISVNGDNTNGREPFLEDDVPNPTTFYGRSKLCAEKGLVDVLSGSETDFIILRPPLIYGPRCRGNFRLLLKLASSMPLLPFGSLKGKKAMMYIENFLDAVWQSLHSNEAANQLFLVSDSETLSLEEIIAILMEQLHGSKLRNFPFSSNVLRQIALMLGRLSQWNKFTSSLEVNSTKFCRVVNWNPTVNSRKGIALSVRDN